MALLNYNNSLFYNTLNNDFESLLVPLAFILASTLEWSYTAWAPGNILGADRPKSLGSELAANRAATAPALLALFIDFIYMNYINYSIFNQYKNYNSLKGEKSQFRNDYF